MGEEGGRRMGAHENRGQEMGGVMAGNGTPKRPGSGERKRESEWEIQNTFIIEIINNINPQKNPIFCLNG